MSDRLPLPLPHPKLYISITNLRLGRRLQLLTLLPKSGLDSKPSLHRPSPTFAHVRSSVALTPRPPSTPPPPPSPSCPPSRQFLLLKSIARTMPVETFLRKPKTGPGLTLPQSDNHPHTKPKQGTPHTGQTGPENGMCHRKRIIHLAILYNHRPEAHDSSPS